MTRRLPPLLGLMASIALGAVHCGAYMDVDDAPRTALAAGATPQPQPEPPPVVSAPGWAAWPMQTDIDPVVLNMPASAETSIESVGKYLGEHEKDPLMLVKALHDWVADRIRYEPRDAASSAAPLWWNQYGGNRMLGSLADPSTSFMLSASPLSEPSPERTFAIRKGVCADYASLLVALARHTGNPSIDVKYVTGYARNFSAEGIDEGYHAWNVAHVAGKAYLLDPTWDSGHGSGTTFEHDYSTNYLFTPPDVFARTHFPDWAEDLHTDRPMTRDQFEAQPVLDPRFYSLALKLDAPLAEPVHAHKHVQLVLENPLDVDLYAQAAPITRAPFAPIYATPATCEIHPGKRSVADCDLPAQGEYGIRVFAKVGTTRLDQVALIEVSSEG